MMLAPYSAALLTEDLFSKIVVAHYGIDGALGEDFDQFLHDSGGRSFHAQKQAEGYGASLFLAGHPVRVGQRHGYVLVGAPAE